MGRSTLQQLLIFLSDIFKNIDDKLQTDAIYLDLRKAFDSVPHDKLLVKLHSVGINGTLWLWFRAYLSSRTQCVVIDGSQSGILPVTSRVPQGSILGPLLFLIFINDIPLLVSVLLYADDTKCYHPLSHVSDSQAIQMDLNSLSHWSKSNISFNSIKSFIMQFTLSSSPSISDYSIDGQPLSIKESCRDLGVIISRDLSWSDHVSVVVAKAYEVLGLLRRSFHSAHPSLCRLLYTSLMHTLSVDLLLSGLEATSVERYSGPGRGCNDVLQNGS